MKNFFRFFLRSIFVFIITLFFIAFFASANSLIDVSINSKILLRNFSHYIFLLSPIAGVIAIFLNFFLFDFKSKFLQRWLSSLFLAFFLFALNLFISQIEPFNQIRQKLPEPIQVKEIIKSKQLIRNANQVLWYDIIPNSTSRYYVATDFQSEFPRMLYFENEISEQNPSILINQNLRPKPILDLNTAIFSIMNLNVEEYFWDRMANNENQKKLKLYLYVFAFAFFSSSFSFISRLTRWPFANWVFISLGFLLLVLLDNYFYMLAKSELMQIIVKKFVTKSEPLEILAVIELLCASIFICFDIILSKRKTLVE